MFHLFYEGTADAVWLVDPSTAKVVDCNKATAALMRCRSRVDLVGKRLEDLSPAVQPDSSPTAEAVRHIAAGLESQKATGSGCSTLFIGDTMSPTVPARVSVW